jgi:hypothetical protein
MLVEPEGEDLRAIDMYKEALTFADWLNRLERIPEGFAESKTARRHWQSGNPPEWAIHDYVYCNLRN